MKLIRRCFIWLLIIILALLIGLKFVVENKGKDFLARGLSKATGQQVKIKEVAVLFPLKFQVKGLTINGLEPAKNVFLSLGWDGFLRQNFQITRLELIEPDIKLLRDEHGKIVLDGLLSNTSPPVKAADTGKSGLEANAEQAQAGSEIQTVSAEKKAWVFIKELLIRDGKFYYSNTTVPGEENFLGLQQGVISGLNATIQNLIFPLESVNTLFSFTGRLKVDNTILAGNDIQGHGWMDIVHRNMKGQIIVKDVEGNPNLQADFVSNNNEMEVVGQVQLSDFRMLPSSPDEDEEVLSFGPFNSAGMDIGARFSFQTRMDEFQLRNVAFSGSVSTKDSEQKADSE